MIWLGVLIVVVLLFVGGLLYVAWYQEWAWRNTSGMAYYGKSLPERRALKERIRRYSRLAMPLVKLLSIGNQKRATMPVFEYEGVCGPPKVSGPEVFERAKNYRPRPEDVFVATQMRCGTTWMQQLVYEIVNRGQGDLSDNGHGHLYATCPWIDGVNSVSVEDSPLVGERPTRIIKTHLPTKLCPYSEQAKYVYVARHPVSCFASIVDYNRALLGPLMPTIDKLATWFCSDRMYWLPWPEHVAGWWQWSKIRDNVLFVRYEEMATDFDSVLDRVARFLGYRLTAGEKHSITEKCSFQYMKENEELFETSPPNMFSVTGGGFMVSGKETRYKEVMPAVRQRILDYCRQALNGSGYPAHRYYPDLATPPASADIKLSLIIPTYNEAERLPGFLGEAADYLDNEFHELHEIVVVDDGSSDATATFVEELIGPRSNVRLIRHEVNRGKGAAVRTGILAARGRLRLFADADGSTPIEEERRLRRVIEAGADVAIGSRTTREIRGPSWLPGELLDQAEVEWKVRLHRHLIGRTFGTLVKSILGLGCADTQCGFKMFRGDAAVDLFSRLTLEGFIFDVEILYLAEKLGYRVIEIPVNWQDVPGSKVRLVRDSWRMFFGLWRVRYRHRNVGKRRPVPAPRSLVERSEMMDPNSIKLNE